MMRTMKIELMFSRPRLKGFLWLVLFVLYSSSSGIDQIAESTVSEEVITKVRDVAKLSCRYKMSESPKSYKIYWQKPENNSKHIAVATAYVHGQEDTSLKDPHFWNRTEMDEQKLTLSIFPVKVSDKGTYHCIILRNFDVQKKCTVHLSVTADFSVPVITQSPINCGLAQMKLTCSSHGGYPQPKMYGFVNNESAEWYYHSISDNQTQLINVTGNLQINITEETLVTCSVGYPGFQKSTSLKISRDCPVEPPPSHGVIIAVSVILIFVAFIVLVIFLQCHNCQRLRSSNRSCSLQPVTTNEMTSQPFFLGASETATEKQVL